MDDEHPSNDVLALAKAADRLDSLADTAELMGDVDAAGRWRFEAWSRRLAAMDLLDE